MTLYSVVEGKDDRNSQGADERRGVVRVPFHGITAADLKNLLRARNVRPLGGSRADIVRRLIVAGGKDPRQQ